MPTSRRRPRASLATKDELLALANRAVPGLVARGGGARDLEVRDLGDGMLVVHVLVDCRDAMGANLVNTVAEAVGRSHRRARRRPRRPAHPLEPLRPPLRARALRASRRARSRRDELDGEAVHRRIVNASRFAELDPYRAATHNKGIMNGIDAVVIATGNDWRAVEAGAHAFAARERQYAPLAIVARATTAATLAGSLELPLALGTVGGTLRVHPAARLALQDRSASSRRSELARGRGGGRARVEPRGAARARHRRHPARSHGAARALRRARRRRSERRGRTRRAIIVEARDITVDGATRALKVIRAGDFKD